MNKFNKVIQNALVAFGLLAIIGAVVLISLSIWYGAWVVLIKIVTLLGGLING